MNCICKTDSRFVESFAKYSPTFVPLLPPFSQAPRSLSWDNWFVLIQGCFPFTEALWRMYTSLE